MFKIFLSLLLVAISCSSIFSQVDPNATCETQALYYQLKKMSNDHLLFGHQNSTFEGLGWQDWHGDYELSDCYLSIDDYPAITGFDFINGYDTFFEHARKTYARGGIVTISDHMDNPATGGDTWDTSGNPVAKILEAGSVENQIFRFYLDETALFFNNLTLDGIHIPVIYRPFHENSGSWFWWGKNHCSPEEFIQLWRFTIDYLRNEKNVHNLLIAYSPSHWNFSHGWNQRYPGDDYVDILGLDQYGIGDFSEYTVYFCQELVDLAAEKDKVAAITEIGVAGGIQNTNNERWYTEELLLPIVSDLKARNIAYAHVWRNGDEDHYWLPIPGTPNYEDFSIFAEHEFTTFESELPNNIYDCSEIQETKTAEVYSMLTYPNPTTDYLKIVFSTPPELKFYYRIQDVTGRQVILESFLGGETQIDLRFLEQGLYILQLLDYKGESLVEEKIIKQ